MNKIEEASTDFGNKYIKSSNEYPLVDNHRRKQLITKDVYDLEEAFEKGVQWAIDEACKWLETALSEKQTFEGYPYVQCDYYVSKEDFIQTFRKILE